jgi:NAD(P)-dependent dehydrogenase (short-subunit alcohol dehydrogenase family)
MGGSPGIASYQAAKFAVDGFSRVLAVETAPFGVKVIVVEPSGFATDWAGSSMTVHEIPADYDGTIGAMQRLMSLGSSPRPPHGRMSADRRTTPSPIPRNTQSTPRRAEPVKGGEDEGAADARGALRRPA